MVAIGVAIIVAEKTVFAAVSNSSSGLEQFGGLSGTVVSASFLILIGLLNLVILAGIVRVFASMRRGEYDEAEMERQLGSRGFFYRFFGRWMKAITKEWQLYPVGVVFGLGFDTATEVALLATTALLASQHIPWYAILCLPILFTAGMTFMDTTDGVFMNLAYGWAFFNPVRKVYYNLAITGLSVAICLFIGGIEALSLLPHEIKGLSRTHGFWSFMYNFNINTAGFGEPCYSSARHVVSGLRLPWVTSFRPAWVRRRGPGDGCSSGASGHGLVALARCWPRFQERATAAPRHEFVSRPTA